MLASSAAIASPLLLNLAGSVPEAKGAEKKTVKKGKLYFITNQCIGCHACKVLCPQKAIFYGERKMMTDQDKCVQCGTYYLYVPIYYVIPISDILFKMETGDILNNLLILCSSHGP